MIPGIVAAWLAGGWPPIGLQSPFFSDDPITSSGWEVAGYPGAFYDSDTNRTYVAWQYVGIDKGAHIAYYDHSAESWSPRYCAGNFVLPNDDHGYAIIVKDADGYIHCLFGSHNNAQQWSVTNAPNDISAWRQMTAISGSFTYPKPTLVGSTIYLFMRDSSSSSNRPLVLATLSPALGLGTWSATSSVIDFGSDSRVYATEVHAIGAELHFCCTRANAGDNERRGVYYFIYDTATGHLLNYNKTVTVTTLPVQITQANADFRIFDHGSNFGDLPSLEFDTSGNAHVLFLDGISSPFPLKHMMLTGGAWSAPYTVAHIVDRYPALGYQDSYHLVPGDSGEIQAWFNIADNKTRRVRDVAGIWDPEETIAIPVMEWFADGTPVRNAHPSLRVLFSETTGDAADSTAAKLPMYAYGDGGFIQQAISQVDIDPYWEQTKILLSCRDGDSAKFLIDDSRSARSAAIISGSTASDAPFSGVRSLRLSSSSQYASAANSTEFSASTAFTIECFVKLNETGRQQIFLTKRGSGSSDYVLGILSSNQVFFNGWSSPSVVSISLFAPPALTTGVWHHIAAVVEGLSARLFVDGVLIASGTVSGSISGGSNPLVIGRDPLNTSNRWLNGWITQVRLTQAARYVSSFTPITVPFPQQ